MTKHRQLPSAELIRTHLDYNAETGVFTWKSRLAPNAQIGSVAGCLRGSGYRTLSILGGKFQEHRIAWLWMTGDDPADLQIDHINGICDDNRWENLRLATQSQNSANSPAQRNNLTGLKGVSSVCGAPNRWQAVIRINGKNRYLGTFSSPELAHEAYNREALAAHETFAFAARPVSPAVLVNEELVRALEALYECIRHSVDWRPDSPLARLVQSALSRAKPSP